MLQSIAQLLVALGGGALPAIFIVLQLVVFMALFYLFMARRSSALSSDSSFALRESDRMEALKKLYRNAGAQGAGPQRLAGTRQNSGPAKEEPVRSARILQLPGIRIDGLPHEILGVSPNASLDEVKKAYRDLMKQYHPDKVGAPGSRAWKDAQKIAEAINSAKERMLSHRKRA